MSSVSKQSRFSVCFRLIWAATAGLAHQLTDALFSVQQLQTFYWNMWGDTGFKRPVWYLSRVFADFRVVIGQCKSANAVFKMLKDNNTVNTVHIYS